MGQRHNRPSTSLKSETKFRQLLIRTNSQTGHLVRFIDVTAVPYAGSGFFSVRFGPQTEDGSSILWPQPSFSEGGRKWAARRIIPNFTKSALCVIEKFAEEIRSSKVFLLLFVQCLRASPTETPSKIFFLVFQFES